MLKIKFRIIVWTAVVLWIVVLTQTAVTGLYVSKTAFRQAFARNQITVLKDSEAAADSRNIKEDNVIFEGSIQGGLSTEEQQKVARNIFREFGGAALLDSKGMEESSYYVAYGYTRGLSTAKKVNGKDINLTVVLSYDENEDKTRVMIGTPLVNSDF